MKRCSAVWQKYHPRLYTWRSGGFTLIELLVVVAIIGILAAGVLTIINPRRLQDEAHFTKAKSELRTLAVALETYALHHGNVYPADVDRDIPAGMEQYLTDEDWPNTPWGPPTTYDWDNFVDTSTGQQVYQFSLRFCAFSDPDTCRFPELDWAEDFDFHSSAYYCISGPCKAHPHQPSSHPGYCINCPEP